MQQGSNATNINNLAATAANCISPNSMAGLQQVLNAQQQVIGLGANNNARGSPGLLSPKHMNGNCKYVEGSLKCKSVFKSKIGF